MEKWAQRSVNVGKIKELFIKYGLVSKDELENLYVIDNITEDVWELRALGLEEI